MPLTLKDALRIAQKDPAFANELLTNPEGFMAAFHLTEKQIKELKILGKSAEATTQAAGDGNVALDGYE